MTEYHPIQQSLGKSSPREFADGAFRNSTFWRNQGGEAFGRSSSWRDINPRITAFIQRGRPTAPHATIRHPAMPPSATQQWRRRCKTSTAVGNDTHKWLMSQHNGHRPQGQGAAADDTKQRCQLVGTPSVECYSKSKFSPRGNSGFNIELSRNSRKSSAHSSSSNL
jgi:hypothetical protein